MVVVACAGGPLGAAARGRLRAAQDAVHVIEVETIGWALATAVFATVASAAAEATPYAVLLAAAKHVLSEASPSG